MIVSYSAPLIQLTLKYFKITEYTMCCLCPVAIIYPDVSASIQTPELDTHFGLWHLGLLSLG